MEFFLIVLSMSFLLSFVLIRFCGYWGFFLDTPNQRSLHYTPTYKMGGLVLCFMWGGYSIFSLALHHMTWAQYVAYQIPVLFGLMGMLDDIRPQSFQIRIVIQVIGMLSIGFFGMPFLEPLWLLLFVVGAVWFVNLYNFMDGSDGLVVGYTLVSFMVLLLISAFSTEPSAKLLFMHLSVSVCILGGFLPFNLPKASAFLGNSGSYFLGSLCVLLASLLMTQKIIPPSMMLLLFSIFILETSIVLITRLLTKKNITQAHRAHFYQQICQTIQQKVVQKFSRSISRTVAHFSVLGVYLSFQTLIAASLLYFSGIMSATWHLLLLFVFLIVIICILKAFKSFFLKGLNLKRR